MARTVRGGNKRKQGSRRQFLERELCERCVCGHKGNWTAVLGDSEVQGLAHVSGIQWQPVDSVSQQRDM